MVSAVVLLMQMRARDVEASKDVNAAAWPLFRRGLCDTILGRFNIVRRWRLTPKGIVLASAIADYERLRS